MYDPWRAFSTRGVRKICNAAKTPNFADSDPLRVPHFPDVHNVTWSSSLTKREWQLRAFFLTIPNQFFAAEAVALPAWGPEPSIDQFRTYVTRLRHRLSPFKGVCEVVNEKGKGYRLVLQQPKLLLR
jgi:DNA-binding response OmpR family regulator